VTGDEEETGMGTVVSGIVKKWVSGDGFKGGGDVGVMLMAREKDDYLLAMVREVVESSEGKIKKMQRETMV